MVIYETYSCFNELQVPQNITQIAGYFVNIKLIQDLSTVSISYIYILYDKVFVHGLYKFEAYFPNISNIANISI